MIKKYFTATGPDATSVVFAAPVKRAIVQINASLTGSVTIYDATATANTGTAGIITNPTVGMKFEYWGFDKGLVVVPSTTCDITASADLSPRGA